MNREFRLYRLTHPDGTAEEWAVAYLGDGRAETRWGSAWKLSHSLVTTAGVAMKQEHDKERKGYRYIARIRFVSRDHYVKVSTHGPTAQPSPPASPPPPPRKPIDIAALLGGDDATDFYF